ncbi:Rrf2 family transcriptional regulator [Kangiella sediminilitoris]|uniref:Transcriptional regulator, BadM/Rrf2 family n=1 Tax=Kangiella sediminilitoris TaxID=1144748 RepID=A0A1B3B8X7_9GAMM|nr:Rrf2 family transcriptional regulator [Kangiella sediminilitoris]AOE49254.1 Transcriptional regulator, BadM/Rrf2 family [Kangiella sediminilitoris]
MNITRYTDYSLRVLMFLALQEGRLTTIHEISDRYKISSNHLMKVVHNLNKKGYIETIRGKNGGIRMKLKASEINIGVLVREMEPDLALVECFSDKNQCIITPVCGLKGVLSEALNSFLTTLDKYTLEDVLPDQYRAQLARILQIT